MISRELSLIKTFAILILSRYTHLQLYSQMLVPKKSTLLINASIVNINKVLSIRAKRLLMSGGLFCEALKVKKQTLKGGCGEQASKIDCILKVLREPEVNIANAERVLNEIHRSEPPCYSALCLNPCGGGYVAVAS